MNRTCAAKVLALAMEIFTATPYSQVTLGDIAKAVCVPESCLIRLFGCKESLYAQAVRCRLYLRQGISFHPADCLDSATRNQRSIYAFTCALSSFTESSVA